MRNGMALTLGLGVLSSVSVSAFAGGMQVMPITFEVVAPATTSTLRIANSGTEPMNAQLRVLRWSVVNGQEHLEPTLDVVVSPPIMTIAPGAENLARLVRISKTPPTQEETYRILADELPSNTNGKGFTLALSTRFSIPAFFEPKTQAGASLAWSIERKDGKAWLVAANNGDRREKISALQVSDPSGRQITVSKGLVGYVLANSSLRVALPAEASKINTSGTVSISANGDTGPLHASAQQIQASR